MAPRSLISWSAGGRIHRERVLLKDETQAVDLPGLAGALHEDDFRTKLANAGFENIDIEVVREYRSADARQFLAEAGLDADAIAPIVDGAFGSAFVRASKP